MMPGPAPRGHCLRYGTSAARRQGRSMGETAPNPTRSAGNEPIGPRERFGLLRAVTLRGAVIRGCLTGLLVCVLAKVGNMLFACNAHVVIPGAVYRCAQPSGRDLEWL